MMRCLTLALLAAAQLPAQNFTAFEAALRSEAAPGVSVAITRGTEVIYRKAFGLANSETNAPVTPDMLFRLGSTTKMIVAATLMTFVNEGKLDLEAPVSRYIPNLPACIGAVSTNQLLTHSAGFKDVAPMFGSHDDSALEANVRSWGADYCEQPAGKQYKYSNPGYVLAGYLAQTLSGKPFADTVEERILRPVGMRQSTFRPIMAMTYPFAEGHDGARKIIRPAPDYAGAWPAGSLFSNTADLSTWVIALLNRNMAPAISKPHMPIGADGKKQYGYGLELRGTGPNQIWEHTGSRDGYGSVIRMYPGQRIGIIILGNWSDAKFPRSLAAAAAALSLPE